MCKCRIQKKKKDDMLNENVSADYSKQKNMVIFIYFYIEEVFFSHKPNRLVLLTTKMVIYIFK